MLNLLIAFPYCKPAMLDFLRERRGSYRLIIDSGAFSAHNSGKTVTLDGYCEFLDSLFDLQPLHAVQLDVIGDPAATWKNFLQMKNRGYDVLPVFTRGSPAKMLERMYEQADYVLLGGMVGQRDNFGFLKWASRLVAGRKVHWLGEVQADPIKLWKPTSVDSSAWKGAMFGTTVVYKGGGTLEGLTRKDFMRAPSPSLRAALHASTFSDAEIFSLSKESGWSPGSFQGEGTPSIRLATLSHLRRSGEVERYVGTRIYHACKSLAEVSFLFHCYDRLKEKGIS